MVSGPALDTSVLPEPPRPEIAEDSTAAEPLSGRVEFRVEQAGPDLPWRFQITNGLAVPVRVAADRSLLWFSVTAPSGKKPQICRLPKELLPAEDARVPHVTLDPGDSFEDRFDPRFYCFAADGQPWLVPGAVIRPRFGWPETPPKITWKAGKRVEVPVEQKPPFAAEVEATEQTPSRETMKTLEGPEFALRSEYSEWSRTRLDDAEARSDLLLTVTRGSDAHSEYNATVEVALSNRSQLSKRVFFRRELVTFEVAGPEGSTSCAAGPDERMPDPSAFERLSSGHRMTFTSRLAELCPRGTFSKPGLYLVYARFEADQSGAAQGFEAFTGTLVSNSPALVRIRTGETPFIRRKTQAAAGPNPLPSAGPGPGPAPSAPLPAPTPPPPSLPPSPPPAP